MIEDIESRVEYKEDAKEKGKRSFIIQTVGNFILMAVLG